MLAIAVLAIAVLAIAVLAIVVLAIAVLEQNLMHLRKQEGSRKKQRGGKFNDGVRDKRNG